jgi:hypothetical protein
MSQKTIKINPAFLSLSKTKKVKDAAYNRREKKVKPKTYASPNIMRKELLSKIKDYQNKVEKERESEETKVNVEEFDDEFNRSLGFLQNLNSRHNDKKSKKKDKRRTLKKGRVADIQVATQLPSDLMTAHESRMAPVAPMPPMAIVRQPIPNIPAVPIFQATAPVALKEPPPYSCLKNGSKPTFREWKRQTQKITHQVAESRPLIRIKDTPQSLPVETVRSKELNKIKTAYRKNNPQTRSGTFIRRRTRTIKYKLGKSAKKVSVLIKNHNTRKLVKHEQGLLKQKSMMAVKNFLREKNLLKTGSSAPNDVLRQMYEQSILAGDVSNKGKDTLIHNYLHDN